MGDTRDMAPDRAASGRTGGCTERRPVAFQRRPRAPRVWYVTSRGRGV
jgi:hypothetical protein